MVAMTPAEVEEHIEHIGASRIEGMTQTPPDVYSAVSPNALYYQVEVGERVVPGDLLSLDPINEKFYKAKSGEAIKGICISYDDLDKTCVMATKE